MTAIVIDNGSGSIKAGFAGNHFPHAVFPACVGYLDPERSRTRLVMAGRHEHYVGAEAQKMRGILTLRYPIDRGIIKDWQAMEAIWSYTFYRVLKTPLYEQHSVLITANPLMPKGQHVRICETMFEVFGVQRVHVANNSLLALTATGRKTGVVVDCGDMLTSVMPVIDGQATTDSTFVVNYGGRDLTMRLIKLLSSNVGVNLGDSSGKREIAREIKEKLCFVSRNFSKDLRKTTAYTEKYQLPDLSEVTLAEERFKCPEALFHPSMTGREDEGIHSLFCTAINKICGNDETRRKLLFSNIVLSGGTTCFEGFAGRLAYELLKRTPHGIEVKVTTPVERKYLSWLGGSMVAANCDWLTKTEYEEYGAPIIFRKFMSL